MFLREQIVRKEGHDYRYLKIVENVWEKNRTKQTTLVNLGNVTNWPPDKLKEVVRVLGRFVNMEVASLADVQISDCRCLGPFLVLNFLWEELRLDQIITQAVADSSCSLPVAQYVRAMVFNRLVAPRSKLGVFEWLSRDVFIPGLERDALPLHGYYRSLERLSGAKAPIEQALHTRMANLFNRDLTLVFYDLTSTYFEGSQCGRSKYGYSRDHRPDCVQIEVGLLVDGDGLTIGHEVFDGNVRDSSTVVPTLKRLKKEFGVGRCVFVSDDGMSSEANFKVIEDSGYEYITSLSLGKSVIGQELVRTCPPKKALTKLGNNLFIHYLRKDETIRYIAAYNPVRAKSTRRHRKERIRACLEHLKVLQAPLKRARTKKSLDAIGEKATEFIVKKRVQALIRVERNPDGEWVARLDKEAIRQTRRQDGLVILQTNSQTLTDAEVAMGYRTLWKVENAFRHIKDLIRLRPIRHWADPRVLGHVCVCVLAYTIECILERKLQQAKLSVSAHAALEEMRPLTVATLKTHDKQIRKRANITQAQQTILNAVGVGSVPTVW